MPICKLSFTRLSNSQNTVHTEIIYYGIVQGQNISPHRRAGQTKPGQTMSDRPPKASLPGFVCGKKRDKDIGLGKGQRK